MVAEVPVVALVVAEVPVVALVVAEVPVVAEDPGVVVVEDELPVMVLMVGVEVRVVVEEVSWVEAVVMLEECLDT